MKTLSTQLAQLIVMIHMALGCAWHHGVYGSGCCESTTGLIAEGQHRGGCDGSEHCDASGRISFVSKHRSDRVTGDRADDSMIDGNCARCEHDESNHRGCHDDRCYVQSLMRFDVRAFALNTSEAIFAVDSVAMKSFPNVGNGETDVVSAGSLLAMGVRAHLFHCVLLL